MIYRYIDSAASPEPGFTRSCRGLNERGTVFHMLMASTRTIDLSVSPTEADAEGDVVTVVCYSFSPVGFIRDLTKTSESSLAAASAAPFSSREHITCLYSRPPPPLAAIEDPRESPPGAMGIRASKAIARAPSPPPGEDDYDPPAEDLEYVARNLPVLRALIVEGLREIAGLFPPGGSSPRSRVMGREFSRVLAELLKGLHAVEVCVRLIAEKASTFSFDNGWSGHGQSGAPAASDSADASDTGSASNALASEVPFFDLGTHHSFNTEPGEGVSSTAINEDFSPAEESPFALLRNLLKELHANFVKAACIWRDVDVTFFVLFSIAFRSSLCYVVAWVYAIIIVAALHIVWAKSAFFAEGVYVSGLLFIGAGLRQLYCWTRKRADGARNPQKEVAARVCMLQPQVLLVLSFYEGLHDEMGNAIDAVGLGDLSTETKEKLKRILGILSEHRNRDPDADVEEACRKVLDRIAPAPHNVNAAEAGSAA
ncbi:uncharacterized protein SCHCODRAFT_01160960 [Schizophyllum commune H4-8]|uniref:Uncharacterized protein n=1 Tax=Schizophyllum commune (strain H4-8 / FGSC 9210) TaxID=578458 RepID=D8QGJ1_SCHCM|nr:uncharacterized protein SCHCODRAFT_01160960 [Schizophyllum commune H4-8]KAI5888089.1 hypothetical protein SCHCODRAFT_01160960 [Schizophyllum commune H4-8]